MYGVLLLPFHGDPTLVTSFQSRADFLAAMNLENDSPGWDTAGQYERAVYEISSPNEIESILREVSATYADSFEACATLIAQWVDAQTSSSTPRDELPSE